jgi:hypothetical protein
MRNQWVMCGQCQRSPGRTRLSGVPRGPWLQRSASPKKEGNRDCSLSGGAADCPVHQWTDDNYCLPNGAPTGPSCLGDVKETPRRMEQYTKHLLNILRRRDLTFAHLIHCVRYLSNFLNCNCAGLLSCASSRLVCVCVSAATLAFVCVAIPTLLLWFHCDQSCKGERLQLVECQYP